MYFLVEDENQRDILSAMDIRGFFVNPSEGAAGAVVAVGSSQRPQKFPLHLEDVELQVRNTEGREIGSYYVGNIEVKNAWASEGDDEKSDLELDLYGYTLPYPYAGTIWQMWAQSLPTTTGQWKALPAEAHESWIHVAQNAWFRSGHESVIYGYARGGYEISGSSLANIDSFYCELGESINGPGGYFGSNADALEDCLSHSSASGKRLQSLTWHGFDISQQNIDDEELQAVLTVLRTHGVEIRCP